jgi:hypothetical protein
MDDAKASRKDEDLAASLQDLKTEDKLYKYTRLEGADDIPILHLEPADSPEAEVQCSLEVVSLSNRPQYEALSYTWGAPIFHHSIYYGDYAPKVTSNLHAALLALRHIDRSRCL